MRYVVWMVYGTAHKQKENYIQKSLCDCKRIFGASINSLMPV